MKAQLHITNGDNFTQRLRNLDIKGEIITWREMLCEGRTTSTVGSESFWKTRYEFLSDKYKVSKSWFVEYTLKEYRSLCNHKKEDNIILWFEYDLFCQINMLAVLSWLKTHRRHANIFLACSGEVKGSNQLKTLSELTDEELKDLYDNKTWLTQDDLEFADYLWQLYCSDNPIRLESIGGFDNHNFQYLQSAIEAHLQRFPSVKTGLNRVEMDILQIGANEKPKTKKEFLRKILLAENLYGFGDSQYDRTLSIMKPLFTALNPVKISKLGKSVLEGENNAYQQLQEKDYYLGGALKYGFLFNQDSGRILKL